MSIRSNKTEERQERFAREYCIDLNGKRAAIAAGYSPKTAEAQASRLLRKHKVSELIAKLKEEQCQKLGISSARILRGLARIAFLDVRRLFDETGSLKAIRDLDDETAAAIAGIEHEKLFEHYGKGHAKHVGTTSKIKPADKLRALELLGKHLNLFIDRVEVSGLEGLAEKLNEIRKRKHTAGGASQPPRGRAKDSSRT